ncbi:Rieske (2Fe-2S) domain-containing protein [Gloeobacter kilaueensis JS1]|uniref:Rieske (2Fe-2S) domain-containing protein n=1 Tax=Gloeobacter kilaueensis (strain ATCC BAA-2537 / CCAP 1431/1 / ULC 316 / JS1) TaxID=1183438 RepID=U5QHS4_GLOK1|nr:Rieske (2Fe-2S) domain-containing protein [Gloeobacter kilaueensis JS1]
MSAQKPHLVEWAGGEIAVFRVNGAFYALDNLCPHKEAPLVAGSQVFEDGQTWVSCPWHRFLFDPATGRCDRAGFDTRAYPVTIEEGQLYIQVC